MDHYRRELSQSFKPVGEVLARVASGHLSQAHAKIFLLDQLVNGSLNAVGVPLYKLGKSVRGEVGFEAIPKQLWSEINEIWGDLDIFWLSGNFMATGRDDAEWEDEQALNPPIESSVAKSHFSEYTSVNLDMSQVLDLLSQRRFIPAYFQSEDTFIPEHISAASSQNSNKWSHWSYIVITMVVKGKIHTKSTPNSLITDAKDQANAIGWEIPSDNTVRQAAEFIISKIMNDASASTQA